MRLGVLDVGSNTVHLVVVDTAKGMRPDPRSAYKATLRLAELLLPDGGLSSVGESKLLESLAEVMIVAKEEGVEELIAFATSAVRDASNADEVITRAREEVGIDLRVLSGEDEARVTFLAVRRWVGWSTGDLMILDIGGGSLEIAKGSDEIPDLAASLPLGAGRLTSDFLTDTDPPRPRKVEEMRDYLRLSFDAICTDSEWLDHSPSVYATSKTFRTLARLARGDSGVTLRREALTQLSSYLLTLSAAERRELPGLSDNRADLIAAGSVIALEAMRAFALPSVKVCPWALREGLTLRWLDGHLPI